MRLLFAAAACTSLVTCLAAQGPVVPKSPTPPTEASDTRETTHLVTVRGCIRGNRLKIDPEASARAIDVLGARDYSLEGPKELMRQVKAEHDKHYEEITGIVVLPARKDLNVVTSTKKVGPKTNVIITGKGKEEDIDTPPEPKNQTLKLKVQQLVHVDNRCTLGQ
jgi:hypothetical protein